MGFIKYFNCIKSPVDTGKLVWIHLNNHLLSYTVGKMFLDMKINASYHFCIYHKHVSPWPSHPGAGDRQLLPLNVFVVVVVVVGFWGGV